MSINIIKRCIALLTNKIAIIGGPGTGKTTLSNILSKIYHLPVYSIDGIKYLKNWKLRDKLETSSIILNTIANNK